MIEQQTKNTPIQYILLTDETMDDTVVLRDIINFINRDDVGTIDLEAALDILFGAITDVASGQLDSGQVAHWIVFETLDYRSVSETHHMLNALFTAYLDSVIKRLRAIGFLPNGRLPYVFKKVSGTGVILLQWSGDFGGY